jgi:hypothetical protein
LLSLSRNPIRGIFSSPSGDVALFQTDDYLAQRTGPPTMSWGVVDLRTGLLVETDSVHERILDWR